MMTEIPGTTYRAASSAYAGVVLHSKYDPNLPDLDLADNIVYHALGLSTICHEAAVRKQWWVEPDGSRTQDNKYAFAAKLMLVVTELAETCEGNRKDLMDSHLKHRKAIEVELADAAIRIFDLGAAYGLDIPGAMAEKMSYNEIRPDHTLAARNAAGGKSY